VKFVNAALVVMATSLASCGTEIDDGAPQNTRDTIEMGSAEPDTGEASQGLVCISQVYNYWGDCHSMDYWNAFASSKCIQKGHEGLFQVGIVEGCGKNLVRTIAYTCIAYTCIC
jgi:hypothetical protein